MYQMLLICDVFDEACTCMYVECTLFEGMVKHLMDLL